MKYLIILFLFFSLIIFPQMTTITGKILDSNTKSPLPKANIFIQENKTIGTTSNEDGSFILKEISHLDSHLVVTYIGYETKVISSKIISSDKNLIIELNS